MVDRVRAAYEMAVVAVFPEFFLSPPAGRGSIDAPPSSVPPPQRSMMGMQ
jgi:hypothetical protein